MCRGVCRVEKKRGFFRGLLYISHGVITDSIGIVEVFILFPLVFSRLAVPAQGERSEEAAAALGSSEEIIETAFEWCFSVEYRLAGVMPLADGTASVAGLREYLGDCNVSAAIVSANMVLACQQGDARGSAHAFAVELGKANAAGSDSVDIWRLNLTAVAAEIRVADVVANYNDDVCWPVFV